MGSVSSQSDGVNSKHEGESVHHHTPGEDGCAEWCTCGRVEEWYKVDLTSLPEDLCSKFVQSNQDAETLKFLDNCYEKVGRSFTLRRHAVANSILKWFMTTTSINGFLKRGSMFVFSQPQLQTLLDIPADWKGDNLLDLGAGDGLVTREMAKFFRDVYVTEASSVMVTRLKERGYGVLGIEEWSDGSRTYDLISCLNLLDRCDTPITILQHIHRSLTPGVGHVIVAVVLPFEPFVEAGSTYQDPSEILHIEGKTVEDEITNLVKNVFEPAGFTLERFTRLPYLCEGDKYQSYYVLDDFVFVLKPDSVDT